MINQRERFVKSLGLLAELCGKQLSRDVLALYDEALRDYGYESLCDALHRLTRERGDRDPFPSIATIRNQIDPAPSEDVEVQNLMRVIFDSVRDYGVYQPAKALKAVGEIGWIAVDTLGGWEHFCTEPSDPATRRAQLRQACVAAYRRAVEGTLGSAPRLPGEARSEAPAKLSEILKAMLPQGEQGVTT